MHPMSPGVNPHCLSA